MTDIPDAAACRKYAGQAAASWTDAQVDGALAAEQVAQANRCKIPTGPVWPADLAEALMRRVLRNIAMRGLALGVQSYDGGGVYIGARDPEITRLEAPYRRRPVG